ncbi:MAG: HAD family hydrolase [Promethearchaeota archaeon]
MGQVPLVDSIKLVIFDLDGVVFDVTDSIRKAASDVIEKYGLKSTVEDTLGDLFHLIEKLQSVPIPKIILGSYELLRIPILEGISLIKRLRILMYFYSRYREYKDEARVFPSIPRLVEDLFKSDVKLAVCTNQKRDYAREVLEQKNLNHFFDLIVGFNEVEKTKPDPEGILKIVGDVGVDASQVAYIGDMVTDVQAGKAAGVKTIAVSSGLVSGEKLKAENPDVYVDDPQGLYDAFFA